MTTSSHSTRDDLTQERPLKKVPTAFAIGFAMAFALAAWVVLPYGVPIFLGATLAATLAPLMRWLMKATKGRKGLAAAICTLLLLFLVVAPLASLLAYGATEVAGGIAWAKESLELSHLKDLAMGRVPTFLQPMIGRAMSGFQVSPEDLEQYGQKGLDFVQQALPAVFGGGLGALASLILVLLATFFFLADGEALNDLIMRLSPLSKKHTRELLDEFRAVGSASLTGLAFSAVGQALVLTGGFWMAGLPHLFFFSVSSLISAFVPLVGSTLVWLPTCLFVGVRNGVGPALGLAAYSIVAVNIVDAGLKPMLMKGKMAMHGGVTFLSMLGGLSVFGPIGFIAGPLAIAFVTAFMRMYQRDYLRQGESLGNDA